MKEKIINCILNSLGEEKLREILQNILFEAEQPLWRSLNFTATASKPNKHFRLDGLTIPEEDQLERHITSHVDALKRSKKDPMPSGDKRSVAYREWKKRQDPNAYKRK